MEACGDAAAVMGGEQHTTSSSCTDFETAQHIELSKCHWSELSEPIFGGLSSEAAEEVKLDNKEAFRRLEMHEEWGAMFFGTFGDHTEIWESLGSLEVGEKFAEGAQAELYHARVKWSNPKVNESDLENQIEWVLKVFKEGTLVRDLQRQWPEGLFRYRNDEYKLFNLGKPLPSRGICGIHSATLLENGRFAFLIEKEDGDLRSLIEHNMAKGDPGCGPFTEEVAEEIMYRVAMGMDYLHGYNIVHRDLKASNVLVEASSCGTWLYCSVADFESSVGVVGTGFWRAPEILRALREKNVGKGQEVFTKEADTYGYGMTCYEVLTGRMPFQDHPLDKKWSLLRDLVIDQDLRPEMPDYVEDWTRELLQWCWKSDCGGRPSFKEIMHVIEANSKAEYVQLQVSKRGCGYVRL